MEEVDTKVVRVRQSARARTYLLQVGGGVVLLVKRHYSCFSTELQIYVCLFVPILFVLQYGIERVSAAPCGSSTLRGEKLLE